MSAFLLFLKSFSIKGWLVIVVLAALFGYHEYDKHRAVTTATEQLQAKIDAAASKAVIQAQTEWHKTASNLDMLTYLDRQQYAAQLDTIAANVSKLKKGYQNVAAQTPLPADCRADPDRVREVNRTLGH